EAARTIRGTLGHAPESTSAVGSGSAAHFRAAFPLEGAFERGDSNQLEGRGAKTSSKPDRASARKGDSAGNRRIPRAIGGNRTVAGPTGSRPRQFFANGPEQGRGDPRRK